MEEERPYDPSNAAYPLGFDQNTAPPAMPPPSMPPGMSGYTMEGPVMGIPVGPAPVP